MAQHVDKPPVDDTEKQASGADEGRRTRISWGLVIFFLALVGVVILTSTGMLIINLVQPAPLPQTTATTGAGASTAQLKQTRGPTGTPSTAGSPNPTPTATPPLFMPGNTTSAPLQVPGGHFVVYEQQDGLYMVSTDAGSQPQVLTTPGYIYNQAVRPVLLPSGQLLYSGDGIWKVDLFSGAANQLAPLAARQVITSMALSSDGTSIAWSTEPANGSGVDAIYAGPLDNPTLVYQQTSGNCPCFSVFSFQNGQGSAGNDTLLLTDGQQSLEAIQFGLWSLDITQPLAARPRGILAGESQRGPLLQAPYSNLLLYSTYEAPVPVPTDNSVPADVATLNFANGLNIATLSGLKLQAPLVLLPKQQIQTNNTAYRWVTTPTFTPDGQTLVYVEFSSLPQTPFDRASALFTVRIAGSGKHLAAGKPQLLATSTARLLELGVWFNSHILTLYADGGIYALDIHSGAATTIVKPGAYARIIAVGGQGGG